MPIAVVLVNFLAINVTQYGIVIINAEKISRINIGEIVVEQRATTILENSRLIRISKKINTISKKNYLNHVIIVANRANLNAPFAYLLLIALMIAGLKIRKSIQKYAVSYSLKLIKI